MNWGDLWRAAGNLLYVFCLGMVFAFGAGFAFWCADVASARIGRQKKVRDYEVLVDQDTGCQYLMTHKGGVTPRLRADGSLFCRSKGKEGDK